MKKIALYLGLASFALPMVALAQDPTYINRWIDTGKDWLSTAIVVIMVIMTLYFLIQVFRFIAEKDATKIKERRQAMLNGMIGLFVAVSVWGIIRIAGNVLGTNGTSGSNYNPTCPPGMIYYPAPINQCR